MDLNMTASGPDDVVDSHENITEDIQIDIDTPDVSDETPNACLVPQFVGGQDITSMRSHFDQDSENIIVATHRQILYFGLESCQQVGDANLSFNKIKSGERIVSSYRLLNLFYVFTNRGQIFIWNLEAKDWANRLSLPLEKDEILISCQMVSNRQYIFAVKKTDENSRAELYYCMSRSARERSKNRELIGGCSDGYETDYDIGHLDLRSSTSEDENEEVNNRRCLAFINGSYVYFQWLEVGKEFSKVHIKQRINDPHILTCVRVNGSKQLVAAGDTLGRIYIYTGDFENDKFNRTKLHWHTLPVNDMCFSSIGNTLYSVGGESGCVVVWDLSQNNFGSKRVIARLGMPIRYINCNSQLNQLVLSFEDNELQWLDTSYEPNHVRTFSRRTIDMFKKNNPKALRINSIPEYAKESSNSTVGLLWHSKTDTVVTNGRTGWLQFYSPKDKIKTKFLNFLKSDLLSLEKDNKVLPSDITKAALSIDGDWLAFYETRDTGDTSSFPSVKLHIWQRSSTTTRWVWIQTIDRLHESAKIVDLKFSPDGQYLVSVSEDGSFQILHRVCLDARSENSSKQMYAKGFVGNVPDKLASLATFSQDSSVLAISLKTDTTLIWMIVDPYKLVYECQLNQINFTTNANDAPKRNKVLGLHFGHHRPSEGVAPLCEVRTKSIRIWNILNSQETMKFDPGYDDEITASAFDHCSMGNEMAEYFAICTDTNLIKLFKLEIEQASRQLKPVVIIDVNLPYSESINPRFYTHMSFMSHPILDIDEQSHSDQYLLKTISRLCLLSSHQELIAIIDKLNLERQSASNNCNAIRTYKMEELRTYLEKNESNYRDERQGLEDCTKMDQSAMTAKQKRIRNRIAVQKMLKDLLTRIPSQNLPQMEMLGPMILDKLV